MNTAFVAEAERTVQSPARSTRRQAAARSELYVLPPSSVESPRPVTARRPAARRPRVEALAAAENRTVGARLCNQVRRILESSERAERRRWQRAASEDRR